MVPCAPGVVIIYIWPLPIGLSIGCSGFYESRQQIIFEKLDAFGVVSSVYFWPLPIGLSIGYSGSCSSRQQLIFERLIFENLGTAAHL